MIDTKQAPAATIQDIPGQGEAPAKQGGDLRVKCDSCKGSFKLDGAVETMPDPDNPRVTIHGLRCPHCKAFTLSFRSDRDLDTKRKRVEEAAQAHKALKTIKAWDRYLRLKEEYKLEFERLNPPKVAA